MEKREDLVLDLRDQQNCNHPCYAAQNLLTGNGFRLDYKRLD